MNARPQNVGENDRESVLLQQPKNNVRKSERVIKKENNKERERESKKERERERVRKKERELICQQCIIPKQRLFSHALPCFDVRKRLGWVFSQRLTSFWTTETR